MDVPARAQVVAALAPLVRGVDHRDRADAGRCLAAFLDVPGVDDVLLELLLDESDTFVTLETARALAARRDRAGLAVLAHGLAEAGAQQVHWIDTALRDVVGTYSDDLDAARRECAALRAEGRAGAGELASLLAAVAPRLVVTTSPSRGPARGPAPSPSG